MNDILAANRVVSILISLHLALGNHRPLESITTQQETEYGCPASGLPVIIADLNGDGRREVAFATRSGLEIYVLEKGKKPHLAFKFANRATSLAMGTVRGWKTPKLLCLVEKSQREVGVSNPFLRFEIQSFEFGSDLSKPDVSSLAFSGIPTWIESATIHGGSRLLIPYMFRNEILLLGDREELLRIPAFDEHEAGHLIPTASRPSSPVGGDDLNFCDLVRVSDLDGDGNDDLIARQQGLSGRYYVITRVGTAEQATTFHRYERHPRDFVVGNFGLETSRTMLIFSEYHSLPGLKSFISWWRRVPSKLDPSKLEEVEAVIYESEDIIATAARFSRKGKRDSLLLQEKASSTIRSICLVDSKWQASEMRCNGYAADSMACFDVDGDGIDEVIMHLSNGQGCVQLRLSADGQELREDL
ncbi:MAG: hypothetical protein JNJ88_04175 [Planctomycetes bacterium]|nr:hypothetical protein [Planctomycetota bacterium]